MSDQRGPRRLGGARVAAFVLSALLLGYLVLMSRRAYLMVTSGQAVFVVLGLAILVLPVLGAVFVVDQLRFGSRAERLARRLDREGGLPDTSHLSRRPSGRVRQEAADAWFEEKRAELEATPNDWRAWFVLAQAYDLAGDRNRGRAAMRRAFALEKENPDR